MPDIKRYIELAKGNKSTFDDLVMSPYNYFANDLDMFKKYSDNEAFLQIYREGFSNKGIEFLKEFSHLLSPTTNIDINKNLRIIEIEEDLINLVTNTDNKIFHRPLFFPTIFINNNIEYDDVIIKGILISEAITHNDDCQLLYGDLYKDYGKNANDYMIAFIAMDIKNNLNIRTIISLIEEENIIHGLSDKKIREINIDNFVKNMVVNIVDMVEGMDKYLSVNIIETTKEQNLKRIQSKHIPLPTKVYIKAQSEFKKYVQRFNEDTKENDEDIRRGKKLYKFIVRGHWRHFRAEKYRQETRLKPKWIKPSFKGEENINLVYHKLKFG